MLAGLLTYNSDDICVFPDFPVTLHMSRCLQLRVQCRIFTGFPFSPNAAEASGTNIFRLVNPDRACKLKI